MLFKVYSYSLFSFSGFVSAFTGKPIEFNVDKTVTNFLYACSVRKEAAPQPQPQHAAQQQEVAVPEMPFEMNPTDHQQMQDCRPLHSSGSHCRTVAVLTEEQEVEEVTTPAPNGPDDRGGPGADDMERHIEHLVPPAAGTMQVPLTAVQLQHSEEWGDDYIGPMARAAVRVLNC